MKALEYHSDCTGADGTVHDYYYHRLRLRWGRMVRKVGARHGCGMTV